MAANKTTIETWTEASVLDALEAAHPSMQWVFIRHVPDATGSAKQRTADAMAMGCWSSTGICLHGFEIKVSRSDWLREMQDHRKAVAAKHCHFWWIIAPEGVAKPEELPANWGLKVIKRRPDGTVSFRVRKTVTENTSATVDYDFLAAIMRKCKMDNRSEVDFRKAIGDAETKSFERGRETEKTIAKGLAKRAEKDLDDLRQRVAAFEAKSGVTLSGWRAPDNAAAAIAHYLKDGHPLEQLKKLDGLVGKIKKDLETGLKVFEEHYSKQETESLTTV